MKTPITPREREEIILEITSIDARIDHIYERLAHAIDPANATALRSLFNNRQLAHATLVGFEGFIMGIGSDRPFNIHAPGRLLRKQIKPKK